MCKICEIPPFWMLRSNLFTVAESSRRSYQITMQSVSKLFPRLLYPIKGPTTIVSFDSNGGRENVVKLGDLRGLS